MRRGEIWLYNADPTVGDEISKTRPCIIVNNDAFYDNGGATQFSYSKLGIF
jgi:mRNA-degrading endonuclease toxin of MazEF toxin-antitoxin module